MTPSERASRVSSKYRDGGRFLCISMRVAMYPVWHVLWELNPRPIHQALTNLPAPGSVMELLSSSHFAAIKQGKEVSSFRSVRMALTSHLRQQVSRKVRQRGEHYYRSRAVFIHTADANSVVATVEGGDTYEVSLSREASTLNVSCTCPYFQGGSGPCKHIWATLLAAEDKGFLLDARGQGPRSLVEDFGDTEEWDGEDSDYGDGEEWYEDGQELEDEDQAVGPDRYPPRARLAPRKRDWKAHLRSLRQGVEQQ